MSAQAPRQPQPQPNHSHRRHHVPNNDEYDSRYDLFAGLWQEAPFVRLPSDAPPELIPFVRNIENPRRVYAIHRASRRHDFQLLVQLYIHQLRDGCGNATCTTSTCFTCRKRLAGKAPIRRYNPTSARTLAVHLASQDNPERGICPSLHRPRGTTPAVNNLVFSKCPTPKPGSQKPTDGDTPNTISRASDAQSNSRSLSGSQDGEIRDEEIYGATPQLDLSEESTKICISERPVTRDYRSFAATTFGTVAFKMIEWLTPNSLDVLSQKVVDLNSSAQPTRKSTPTPSADPQSLPANDARDNDEEPHGLSANPHNPSPNHDTHAATKSRSKKEQSTPKRNSKSSFRSKPTVDMTRRKSIEPVCVTAEADNTSLHRPTRVTGFHPDKLSQRTKSPTTITFKPAFFENVPLPPSVADELTVASSDGEESTREEKSTPARSASNHEHRQKPQSAGQRKEEDLEDATAINCPLPQALSRLNVDIVDFIYSVYLEDGTSETDPHLISEAECKSSTSSMSLQSQMCLQRTSQKRDMVCKKSWKDFHEQSLFSVLSDPISLIASFSDPEYLFDSQRMWYCMVRLMRISPSLVLHSLWLSAASLFVLPEDGNRKEESKSRALSPYQAECVITICLHALAAFVPAVTDTTTMLKLSLLRSKGIAFAAAAEDQCASDHCLQYDDVFSNSLALRLARRIFLAFTIRRKHGEFAMGLLLSQLDAGNHGRKSALRDARAPALLLDWARAVLLHEWDGNAHFCKDSAFYGALLFIEASYLDQENILLTGGSAFQVQYFSKCLDIMRVPVQWVTTDSTDDVGNILDHPFLFNSKDLVTYFRSINFSSMSRSFEEASSLKRRMSAIVDPGSLITNPHHKVVLKDMLRTAASRYLVLDIGRATVLRDAFDQLWRRQRRELLRPLKIHLGEDTGEQGFDSGGVQQEFFRLAIAECLDPVYGAFTVDDRSHMAWFKPQSTVEDWKFELMGVLLSLAVYNGVTLPVNFPTAFYRRLLKEPVDEIKHIEDGWPALASGLTQLLEWDESKGLIMDIFARTYEFTMPGIGKELTIHMLDDKQKEEPGSPISIDADVPEAEYVTVENRDDYVKDYISYLTDVSVRPQLESFRRGFLACLSEKALTLLTPELLQSIVEGERNIDIAGLRRCTRYVGWDASHQTIRDFWSIVKRYDNQMKRKLLQFVTASDRVPVSGIENIQFTIQKNGESAKDGRLPTAYTCYGNLLLPEFQDKEVLRERLAMALENAQGFGFA
ncbi:HECT domain protein [Cordyceps fumosorosea ARSEF 2679]|uniref:HECT-type E3 ubiquitin transferase n=1 Tax=Cordyceps fumosorosea (strain ARSEF 2679) TaxID=1081104 RepID=A0A168AR74_CORFA|nr:HECT domain protein [Cordyceps fumosorosea ARSEF 2679]OAA69086.1 HECT domain protein [Cordyceps fumosorosea ARSEF 2679]